MLAPMRMLAVVLNVLIVGCGDNGSRAQPDSGARPPADAAIDMSADAACNVHGMATAPSMVDGRPFAPFVRAAAVVVFTDDPYPAILIEAGPNPRCPCDAPPAGGPGNTLVSFITDWPVAPGAALVSDGPFVHVDSQMLGTPGTGSMTFTTVTPQTITGSMTVKFPGDSAPQQIDFEAVNCNAT